jgi:hypothetical protein
VGKSLFVVLFITVVFGFVGCDGKNCYLPTTSTELTEEMPEPEPVTEPTSTLVSVSPSAGAPLYAGDVVEFTVQFSLPKEMYPITVEAALMAEPVGEPGSFGWGCSAEVRYDWQYSDTFICRIDIVQEYLYWWREEGFSHVDARFRIYRGTGRNAHFVIINESFGLHYAIS